MSDADVIEVLSPGTLTTVQDWPGRLGYWDVGVPPSGPMDERSFRLGNRLLGNPEGAAGLEVTLTGPRLRFAAARTVSVTGAPLAVTLEDAPMPQWTAFDVPAGAVLTLGAIRGVGMRAYLLVAGGLAGPRTMGSRAVFAMAQLGGRALCRGDALELADTPDLADAPDRRSVTSVPGIELRNEHTLRVVLGPQGAPEFLTAHGLSALLSARWRVHHHSDRTGIRLIGPRPRWAREDGGEAGLHPSNILDSAYSLGTVMLAGDMAVIVGPDGPSLGGFIAVGQVIRADRWRLGQLRAGDSVELAAVRPEHAVDLHAQADAAIAAGAGANDETVPAGRHIAGGEARPTGVRVAVEPAPATGVRAGIARAHKSFDRPGEGAHGPIAFRRAGECAVLVEFGGPQLELRSRVRAQALLEALQEQEIAGVGAITPGVRSLHVQHQPERLSAGALVDVLARLERELPAPERDAIPGRAVYLPLAWRHSEVARAVERYASSVRADAPWCPDNIDFIRRINGLPDERAVREIVFAASYLVLGLGDVYLGAPVAVPLDPRHRLVSTKYNPARTWTPANAVGIGGAFLCVYGIEGPGGYQLVGRTVQVWHAQGEPPWRLRHFDQLRFEPVAEAELEELRAASDAGCWAPRIERLDFSLAEHEAQLRAHAGEIAAFRARRQAAFDAEREAWQASEEMLAVGA